MEIKKTPEIIRTGDFIDENQILIRPLANSRDLFAVYRLTNEYYGSKGLSNIHPDGIWALNPEFDHIPQTTVLVAQLNGDLVGSISMTNDGLKGLTVDRQFGRTCALIRAEGKRTAEIWRLVTAGTPSQQMRISAELLSTAIRRLIEEKIQTCLLSLHPDLVNLCQEKLDVVTLIGGQFTPTGGLFSLPMVLMRCNLEKVAKHLREKAKASA